MEPAAASTPSTGSGIRRTGAWRALASGAVAIGVILPAAAEPEAVVSQALAEAASQRGTEELNLTPEVSATRTRLAPSAVAPIGPDGRPLSDLAGVQYRLWLSRGRTDIGVGLGTVGYVAPRPDGRVDGPVALAAAAPEVSLGLRYRVSRESAIYADASGTRGLGTDPTGPYVKTKVGLEWKPAKQKFGFDHGAIGVHLDSGYHLALKARHGGVGLYLRGQF